MYIWYSKPFWTFYQQREEFWPISENWILQSKVGSETLILKNSSHRPSKSTFLKVNNWDSQKQYKKSRNTEWTLTNKVIHFGSLQDSVGPKT